jgi:phosphatidylinositol/phosphatidylcholine transfer protein
MCWVLDFSARARSPDGRQVAEGVLHVLQNHYPERLGAAYLLNAPWWMSALFTVISPFIEATTKRKLHWVKGKQADLFAALTVDIEPEQLERMYGGKRDIPQQFQPSSA